jgi:hypothetical protein
MPHWSPWRGVITSGELAENGKAYNPTYITQNGLASSKNSDFKPFRVIFLNFQVRQAPSKTQVPFCDLSANNKVAARGCYF